MWTYHDVVPLLFAVSPHRTYIPHHYLQRQSQDLAAKRRQRIEDLIRDEAIPESVLEINLDLVIGSGGAGKVYMANLAGANAAAKVCFFFLCVLRRNGSVFGKMTTTVLKNMLGYKIAMKLLCKIEKKMS